MRWVDCREFMPPDHMSVLALVNHYYGTEDEIVRIHEVYYSEKEEGAYWAFLSFTEPFEHFVLSDIPDIEVTHWSLLPELPDKQGKSDGLSL